ncbi:MAG: IS200/IS605 family accessory protein TnpB-related protein [Caldilineaceae bacterium]
MVRALAMLMNVLPIGAQLAHQESRKLVNEYQFIALEKLDIQDMQVSGNKTISRGIADVAWGQFVQFTTYKAENAGRGVALVNPRARRKHAPVADRLFLRTCLCVSMIVLHLRLENQP